MLAPVFRAWPDAEAAGARLAEILSLPVEQAGPVMMQGPSAVPSPATGKNMENGIRMPTNSWSGLMPGKKSWGLSSRGLKRPDRTKKIS